MNRRYIIVRIITFLLTIIVAATINFTISKLTPQDPMAAIMGRMASKGRMVQGGEKLLEEYKKIFKLDQPIYVQYISYMQNLFFHGDLGYSIAYYPAKVKTIVLRAIPWTIALITFANLLAFAIGNFLGALCAWPSTSNRVKKLIYLLMPFSAIPYYLLALILIYIFAIKTSLFPLGGGLSVGSTNVFSWRAILDYLHHAALPALSISLSLIGFWALSMRGRMISVIGQNYLFYAKAKGLHEKTIFFNYAIRNALLPQITALAIDVRNIFTGSILVEIIFNYPGIGSVLYKALKNADYLLIQGVVMFIVIAVASATLSLDLIYPKLDPRVKY